MDAKQEIIGRVRQIDDLRAQVSHHWSMARDCVNSGDIDAAIPLLNAYFTLKEQLEGVESRFRGMLKGQFSDR